MAKSSVNQTAFILVAWVVGIYALLKLGPNLLKGLGGAASTAYGGQYGQGGIAQNFNGGYSYGFPGSGQISIPDALKLDGLSPDSAQSLAELYNAQQGRRPNGDPLTPAEQAGLIPQYDNSTDAQSIAATPYSSVPDTSLLSVPAGTSWDAIPDNSGGDPNYLANAAIIEDELGDPYYLSDDSVTSDSEGQSA